MRFLRTLKSMHRLAQLDHTHVWHPFTQMRDWLKCKPIVITRGKGATLTDQNGRDYLDGNSSIWTNLHGHNHPTINSAVRKQLKQIAHSSALGFANEPASLLAAELVNAANPTWLFKRAPINAAMPPKLNKVFYSDDGSTALEVALKQAYEFTRRTRGPQSKPRFLSIDGAYHGDTIGAVSLGHIDLFHKAYRDMLFPTDKVMAPYCYRCPFNRARPENADARTYRKCGWECLDKVERAVKRQHKRGEPFAGFVFEPLMQGAAGMIPQPEGWLERAAEIIDRKDTLLIADEVMTGFGRTGAGPAGQPSLFASHREFVQPDFLCLAKGLTGGYLPMAATLTSQRVFDAFLGEYEEFKTFFHGHSYTGNQLGAAAARASLELLQKRQSVESRRRLERDLEKSLQPLWNLPAIGDVRREGLVVGIELVKNRRTREPFALAERAGIRVCEAMARRGVLTRPIGNVIVLMPPYCTTRRQVGLMTGALRDAIDEVFRTSATA